MSFAGRAAAVYYFCCEALVTTDKPRAMGVEYSQAEDSATARDAHTSGGWEGANPRAWGLSLRTR